ncbi:MAG: transposase [Rickettsiales bacterium]|nr:MAG: transposase [Rickettsiales bacterium]
MTAKNSNKINKNKKQSKSTNLAKAEIEKPKKLKHDEFMKETLGRRLTAIDFVKDHLPAKMQEQLDLSTLEVEKETHVEKSLKKRMSDLVYSVKTKKGDDAYIYMVLEHQSSVDRDMALRLQRYQLLLCQRHRDNKEPGKLPIIFPLVIYHGKRKYTAPLSFWELFDDPEYAKEIMAGNYTLIDLRAMSDDDINYDRHHSLAFAAMKHIYDRDTLKMLDQLLANCKIAVSLDKREKYLFLSLIIEYTSPKVPAEKREELAQVIQGHMSKEDGVKFMKTVRDSYIDEGYVIGEKKGAEQKSIQIATNLLNQNLDQKFVASVTGLSAHEILKLKSSAHNSNDKS